MRAVVDFQVKPRLPEGLEGLEELAYNLWWSWHPRAIDLFRSVDEGLWESTRHNPVLLLGSTRQERLEALAEDQGFLEFLGRVHGELAEYLAARGWFEYNHGPTETPSVAYFSMEYGLTECLPNYSGGLGVLAGDHLKSASDLGVPLVGVGLLYQQGYFEQYLNIDGWQQERYPVNDLYNLPVRPVSDARGGPLVIRCPLGEHEVAVQLWRCTVGKVLLLLLDTNLDVNEPIDRGVTDQLYGGEAENRIRQEMVLGIGGIRALSALGIRPPVCHLNEGHAAFLNLERIRMLMEEEEVPFRAARAAVFASNVFTSHTPVPAGIDVFDQALVRRQVGPYLKRLGIAVGDFLKMGHHPGGQEEGIFNMAIMALTNSASVNAVSELHQKTTRRLVREGFPGIPEGEIPVRAVTNGVHLRSWISHDMSELFDRYLGSAWQRQPARPETWEKIAGIPDSELWRTHERRRERLVAFTRRRLVRQLRRRGAAADEITRAEEVLDPAALTVGFARRFAAYKRATLLLADRDRLLRLLTDTKRPVQLIFAGKAHPRDEAGKELIRQLVHFARDPQVRDHIAFLEDYNLNVARYLVQGVDVWLNTPRRPLEASGTSGMKVAANGGLNLSVLDGWWDEAYRPEVGWAIGAGEEYEDPAIQDAVESAALYHLLESQVVPAFYERGRDQLPHGWIGWMKASMSGLSWRFNSDRMVREYTEELYLPARQAYDGLAADGFAGARELSAWKEKVYQGWGEVAVESVSAGGGNRPLRVGDHLQAEAVVRLGALAPRDVTVELWVGPRDENREVASGEAVGMEKVAELGEGRYRYRGAYPCSRTGSLGLGVRVLPAHSALLHRHEMALIRWA